LILGDAQTASASGERATLDDLFRRAAVQRPNAIALADPPNRESFTHGAPKRLTFAEADHVIWAVAAKLRRLGLQPDTVVGLQLPNTVESVLVLLGVLRAGLIASPLPLLWRKADAATALRRVGAKMIITSARVGGVAPCDHAMEVAAEIFSIRFVGAFGDTPPDGVIPLDDVFTADKIERLVPIAREENPAAHVALVTWEATAEGLVAVARSHNELIAGGQAVVLEGGVEQDASILAPCASS
jgi:non-ribosomal peptide synthetase component E (peptide arylation enzyme)